MVLMKCAAPKPRPTETPTIWHCHCFCLRAGDFREGPV